MDPSTRLTFKANTYATVTQLYKPWGGRKREARLSRFRVRYQSGILPTGYTHTGPAHAPTATTSTSWATFLNRDTPFMPQ